MNALLFKLANLVMNFSMLGDAVADPDLSTPYYNEATEEFIGRLAFLNPILNALDAILTPLLVVVATAGSIYAVILGVNMARAETADKREEAKKRIINAVVALGVTIVLILLLGIFKENIGAWINPTE